MEAIEFQTYVHDGVIKVPQTCKISSADMVRVIILKQSPDSITTGDSLQEYEKLLKETESETAVLSGFDIDTAANEVNNDFL